MKILFFGDSITDMNRSRDEGVPPFSLGEGYVFDVVSDLQFKYGTKYEFVNRGISGNRIVDLYARIKSDCVNLEPDVISILIGVNDIWHELEFNNGVEIDRFIATYKDMINYIRKKLPKTKLMILEPFILEGSATKEKFEGFKEVYSYAKEIKKMAKEYNIPFVPLQEKMEKLALEQGVTNVLFDGVHPNVAGARLIANEWENTFFNEVEKC